MLTYEILIERIIGWAEATPDVRAALLIGSRARTDHPADKWSDLDVLVFAHNPEQFVRSDHWATALAPVWLTFTERIPDGRSWERRIL
jgi:aminoglycoside 6-adenylyltransferase